MPAIQIGRAPASSALHLLQSREIGPCLIGLLSVDHPGCRPGLGNQFVARKNRGNGTEMNVVAPLREIAPETVELTILMPCLNEAETLAACIRKAKYFLSEEGVAGEVLVADNGSTDGSQQIAAALGARVVNVARKGYGAALLGGIAAARGRFIVMGDADDSYDFSTLGAFLDRLREGADLVMGNRFKGGIEAGAMPPLHRY